MSRWSISSAAPWPLISGRNRDGGARVSIMKLNFKSFPYLGQSPWAVIFLSLLIPCLGFTQTNDLDVNWWLNQKSITWSAEANHFRTGVGCGPVSPNREIYVAIMSLNKKGLTFVFPPSGKFPIQILRDESGTIIDPIIGKTDGELPKRISANDLPHSTDGKVRGHGTVY
jgi:hypothetical protein